MGTASSGLRVLLVEDNPGDARLIRALLAEADAPFTLARVERLDVALARLRAEPFDVVLLDLGLPDSQGLETFARAQAQAPGVPLVVLTGLDDDAVASRAVQAGAQDYLAKAHLTAHTLVRAIRYSVERQQAQEALRLSEARLRELYTRLQAAYADLERSQEQTVQQERLRALGTMASGIAHDFNNALAPILGFSELLLARPGDLANGSKVRQYLELIHTAAQDGAGIVRRLREFYRPRDAHEVFAPVDVTHLVSQAVALARPRWKDQAQARGVTIAVETDLQAVPPVVGQEGDLREALVNLLLNAVDAIVQKAEGGRQGAGAKQVPAHGTITLRSRLDAPPQPPDSVLSTQYSVLVEVADTGIGMPEEVRRRALEPFFTTKGEAGSGLGLAMVHGAVRRHEGTLEIESAAGQGTTVRLRLPVHVERPTVGPSPQPPVPPEKVPSPQPLRVLVVDDDAVLRTLVADSLAGDGHRVETAADGLEGLAAFRHGRFDVVITDLAMPGLNGVQLAGAIKRAAPATPVVLVTGFGDLFDAAGRPPAGIDAVLGKPASPTALRDALRRVAPPGA